MQAGASQVDHTSAEGDFWTAYTSTQHEISAKPSKRAIKANGGRDVRGEAKLPSLPYTLSTDATQERGSSATKMSKHRGAFWREGLKTTITQSVTGTKCSERLNPFRGQADTLNSSKKWSSL